MYGAGFTVPVGASSNNLEIVTVLDCAAYKATSPTECHKRNKRTKNTVSCTCTNAGNWSTEPNTCSNLDLSILANKSVSALCSALLRSHINRDGPANEAADENNNMRPWLAPTYFVPNMSDW